MKSCPNTLPHSRLGIIVAKKTAKGAVGRNRIRRIVADVFAKDKTILKKPGLDRLVIINPSDKLDGAYYEDLKKEVALAAQRLNK